MENYSGVLSDASVRPVDRPRRRPNYREDNIMTLYDVYSSIRRIRGYRDKAVVLEFTNGWSSFCHEAFLVDVYKGSGAIVPLGIYITTIMFTSEIDMPNGMDFHLFKEKFMFKNSPHSFCTGGSIVDFIEKMITEDYIYEELTELPALMTTTSTGWGGVGEVYESNGQIIFRSTFAMEEGLNYAEK